MLYRFVLKGLLLCACLGAPLRAGEPDYPRLANVYLHGFVEPTHIPQLARWNVVVLSTAWTEEQLATLRALNPNIRIYLYVCAYCVDETPNPTDTWNQKLQVYARDFDMWWYDAEGRVASDWPGSRMVNVVSQQRRGPIGGHWLRFFELFLSELVESRPSIDGIFFDNMWRALSWNQDRLRLDSDCNPTSNPAGCDGVPDSKAWLDLHWNRAMNELLQNVRRRFDTLQQRRARPLSIISNSSSDYFQHLNGTLYEFFPSGSQPDYGNQHNYAWRQSMFQYPNGYRIASFRRTPYRVSIINSGWQGNTLQPARTPGFDRHKRFTLGSTLLGNGYFSLDTGPQGHGNLWWEPEFDHAGQGSGYLGQPLNDAYPVLMAGGPEMLANSDFRLGLESWNSRLSGVAGSANVLDTPYGGLLQLALSEIIHPGGTMRLSQAGVRLIKDQVYTIRFSAQTITPTPVEVSLSSPACPNERCLPNWRFGLDTVTRQYAVSFVAPADAEGTISLLLREPALVRMQSFSLREGSQDLYRRDFQHGSVVVNYTPAPQLVSLGNTVTRLMIPGSTFYDGRSVDSDWIDSGDAIIYVVPANASGKAIAAASPVGATLTSVSRPAGTVFRLSLPQSDTVHLRVFDVRGRLVQHLQPGVLAAGTHEILWNHEDTLHRQVGRGVYLVQMQSSQEEQHRKVVLWR